MNRIKNGLVLGLIGISYLLIFHFSWQPNCFFKKITSIPCPACGMTRAFEEILNGNIITSFSYNVIAFPLFCFFIMGIFLLIYGLFFNKDTFFLYFKKIFEKYYGLVLSLLMISWMVNLIRGI